MKEQKRQMTDEEVVREILDETHDELREVFPLALRLKERIRLFTNLGLNSLLLGPGKVQKRIIGIIRSFAEEVEKNDKADVWQRITGVYTSNEKYPNKRFKAVVKLLQGNNIPLCGYVIYNSAGEEQSFQLTAAGLEALETQELRQMDQLIITKLCEKAKKLATEDFPEKQIPLESTTTRRAKLVLQAAREVMRNDKEEEISVKN